MAGYTVARCFHGAERCGDISPMATVYMIGAPDHGCEIPTSRRIDVNHGETQTIHFSGDGLGVGQVRTVFKTSKVDHPVDSSSSTSEAAAFLAFFRLLRPLSRSRARLRSSFDKPGLWR